MTKVHNIIFLETFVVTKYLGVKMCGVCMFSVCFWVHRRACKLN